jgi:hypothetical protein
LIEQHQKISAKKNYLVGRVVISLIAAALLAFSIVQILSNIDVTKVDYRETGTVNYTVCLKPNQYFEEECLDKNRQYVASLIREIRIDYDYGFSTSMPLDYRYDYEVTAEVVATEKDNAGKILYSDKEIIQEQISQESTQSQRFQVQKHVNIDYGKYNDLMVQFRKDYNLSMDANLVVTMAVSTYGEYPDFAQALDSKQNLTISIPLSERTLNVGVNSKDINNSNSLSRADSNVGRDLVWYLLALISIVILITTAYISVLIFARNSRAKSRYERALAKITKEYNQLIIEATHIPEIKKSQVVTVNSFDELLDVRETIQKPILHIKISHDKSLFAIEDGRTAYTYTLQGEKSRRVKESPSPHRRNRKVPHSSGRRT